MLYREHQIMWNSNKETSAFFSKSWVVSLGHAAKQIKQPARPRTFEIAQWRRK